MRYNELIKEASFGNRVVTDANTIKKYIEDNNIDTDVRIYRGFRNLPLDTTHVYYSKNPTGRISANTSNYFTSLVDGYLPEWKDYPKRSESFICTTNAGTASMYGLTCRMLPAIPNTKIAVAPYFDIWESFKIRIPKLNEMIWDIYRIDVVPDGYSYVARDEVTNDNIGEIISTIDINVKKWMSDPNDYAYELKKSKEFPFPNIGTITSVIENYGSFGKYLQELLNPDYNSFELVEYGSELKKYNNKNHEVWFSSPAYIIPIKTEAHYEIFGTDK